jgi:RHS repeat-associated protein
VATSYGYSIYQLLSATQGATTTESYTYDPVGNRLSSLGVSSYTNNSSNQLTATSNASYGYDLNGNAVTKNDSTGITTYAWDFENRLTSVTLPGTGGTVSFSYDPFGRRIKRSSSTGTSIYAYDGPNLIEETNNSGAVVARYSQSLGIDGPLAMLRSSTTSYYQQDGISSITSLSNGAGTLTQTYTFDSFGKTTASSGSLTNPFQYAGREFDAETGLYYMRARYFDPATGRFISEDPVGFDGGGDFYEYSFNEPTTFTDPFGLQTQAPTAPPPVKAPPVSPPKAPPVPKPTPPRVVPEPVAPEPLPLPEGLPTIGPIIGAIGAIFIPMPAGPECLDVHGTANCPDPKPTQNYGCRYIGETSSGGECKTCMYRCKGYGGIVTFPQAVGKPCPGITPDGLVDTSQIDPKCRGQKKQGCPAK